MEEAATQAAQRIQQSDDDEALAKRSEVRGLRSSLLPYFKRRISLNLENSQSLVL